LLLFEGIGRFLVFLRIFKLLRLIMLIDLFLKRIFLSEKCPNIIHQWFETWRFGNLSFLNEIFLAEKYPNIIHQWIET